MKTCFYGWQLDKPIFSVSQTGKVGLINKFIGPPNIRQGEGKCKIIYYYLPPQDLPFWEHDESCRLINNFILLAPYSRLSIYSDGVDQFTVIDNIKDDFVVPDKFKIL
jgi:hypothetical protein